MRNCIRQKPTAENQVLGSVRVRARLTLDERNLLDEVGKRPRVRPNEGTAMHLIPDANKQIRELNQEIQKEQDPQRFMELVRELNHLLDGDGRTANDTARPPAPFRNQNSRRARGWFPLPSSDK